MSSKDTVVISIVDPAADAGSGPERWDSWRPTVSLARQPDLPIARFELIFDASDKALARRVAEDIVEVSPETDVRSHQIDFGDPRDFASAFGRLHELSRSMLFFLEEEDYLLHVTAGTETQRACLILLAESRHFPADLVQTSAPLESDYISSGRAHVLSADLASHASIAPRLEADRRDSQTILKGGIETRDEDYNEMIARMERVVGASPAPMLITGAPGTGKTSLARRLGELARALRNVSGGVHEVNCAALGPGEQAATFIGDATSTGAPHSTALDLDKVERGVIVVDEVARLAPRAQVALLDALDSGRGLQLVATTSRDLDAEVRSGRFDASLLACISYWSFELPSLTERPDDIEPNLDHELQRWSRRASRVVDMTPDARARFLDAAGAPTARWPANFRDLNACIGRMATLAANGRIDEDLVDDEVARLRRAWGEREADTDDKEASLRDLLGEEAFHTLDRFDRVQLADVVHVCRESDTLSEAGRRLFAVSREQKKSKNDADRPSKYLAKFGLRFSDIE